jgi:myo-inositol-1(or 4)-monophosphatase
VASATPPPLRRPCFAETGARDQTAGVTPPNPSPDPGALLELAVDLARRAGDLALSMREGVEVAATKTTPTDVVTAADAAAEQLVVEGIRAARPGDGLLGEEGGEAPGTTGVRWVVDPIDGTVNFLYGVPQWAVSIAVEVDGEVAAGVVHDPAKQETWTALRGEGAWLNGRRLRCSGATDLAQALVATGFSYDARRRAAQAALLPTLLPRVRDIRRLGAGALDLCCVAAGRVDGYYEQAMNPWDWSAGALVAREAGARVGGLRGRPEDGALVLAAAPGVFDALHDLLVELDADHDPLV